MRTVAIINQKGGCGKTTTAVNLAGALARMGQPTLLVDMDPQSHCAVGLGIPEDSIDRQVGDAMLTDPNRRLDETRLLWKFGQGLDLIPSTMRLAGLEAAHGGLAEMEDRDQRLLNVIERFDDRYEWCLIDCPPSIGLLTFNALRAASEVLIPVETSFFSLRGAQRQARTIESLARRLGGRTPYRILPTMHDPNHRLANEILQELNDKFPDQVIPHAIRRDEKLKEAASFGQPLIEYEHHANGAMDYADLAVWMIAHPPSRSRGRAAAQARKMPPPIEAGSGIQALLDAPKPAPTETPAAEPEPRTQRTERSERPAEEPTRSTRAAELALRARRLLAETAAVKARIDADPDVAQFLRENGDDDRRPTREQLQRLFGVHQTSKGALFVHPGGETSRLFVAGDFNGWSPTANPLRFNKRLGVHEACVPLASGTQRYRLIVDGRWVTDPFNKETTADRFGELTSVITVRKGLTPAPCEGAD